MSDLINREMVIKALKDTEPTDWDNSNYEIGKKNQWASDAIAILAITPVEPKKGHWNGISDGYADGYPVYDEWECSCCGLIEEGEEPTWNYCPNCGAKMGVEEK